MNRRSFIKSTVAAGAALLVPTWGELPKRRINLQAFCSTDDLWRGNGVMTSPFIQHAATHEPLLHRYATDGRICVRVACAEADKGDEQVKRPAASKLGWERETGNWMPWPRENYVVKDGSWCWQCESRGIADAKQCPTCKGYGHRMDQHFEKPCATCEGRGLVGPTCQQCKGKGEGRFANHQLMPNGLWLCPKYDRLVRAELPGLEFCPDVRMIGTKPGPLHIRFDGGEGMIMSLLPDMDLGRCP